MARIPKTSLPLLGRSDLLRTLYLENRDAVGWIADQLGLVKQVDTEVAGQQADSLQQPGPISIDILPQASDSRGYPEAIEDLFFWTLTARKPRGPLESTESADDRFYYRWKNPPTGQPEHEPISKWSDIGPRLRDKLADLAKAKQLDLNKLVERVAKGEMVYHLPRRRKRRWGNSLQIIVDISNRLAPFRFDQQLIINQIQKLVPKYSLRIYQGIFPPGLSKRKKYEVPSKGAHILVLGDLGAFENSPSVQRMWLSWGRGVVERGAHLLALFPGDLLRLSKQLRSLFSAQSWKRGQQTITDAKKRSDLVNQLLTMVSPAICVEPGFLRTARRMIPDAVDPSLEIDFWQSPNLWSNHPKAATINAGRANSEFRPAFEQLPDDQKRRILQQLRSWRVELQNAPEVWFEEVLSLHPDSQQLLALDFPADLEDARAWLRKRFYEFDRNEIADDQKAYVTRAVSRLPRIAFMDPEVGGFARAFHRALVVSKEVVPGTDPREIPSGPSKDFVVDITDQGMAIGSLTGAEQNSLTSIKIESGNDTFVIKDDFLTVGQLEDKNLGKSFWTAGKVPNFVSDFGVDQFGLWISIAFDVSDPMIQMRLRWVPPGEFLMGSPDSEPGRGLDEIQHRVQLTNGFWIGESPVTQNVWRAVTGENPSYFQGDLRPVERVSWNDTRGFFDRVSSLLGEEVLDLPSEAQWEYACRGNTPTAYWTGEVLKESDANFDQNIGETSAVAQYSRNPFGLFDVHGNVWEWCLDWYGSYEIGSSVMVNPTGSVSGSRRVLRGGGWLHGARLVRSAARYPYPPGLRSDYVGFRCLSSVEVAEPSDEAIAMAAERAKHARTDGRATKIVEIPRRTREAKAPCELEIPLGSIQVIEADRFEYHVQRMTKPAWAKTFGRDPYGLFADFEIEVVDSQVQDVARKLFEHDARTRSEQSKVVVPLKSFFDPKIVRQRLRFIPPGSLMMGSPESEVGRSSDELLHPVVLTSGFWILDTPVTQHLWLVVMESESQSKFKGLLRPVENVSWEQANEFCEVLEGRIGLDFRLPTEAEWEYACRSGTETATFIGDLDDIENSLSIKLAQIAHYGYDSVSQKTTSERGTIDVKTKLANSFGLFDMLGNVWEWCSDWYGPYEMGSSVSVDPTGLDSGLERVLRGGSWVSAARYVRSASRYPLPPGSRSDSVGFRCLSSVQSKAERDIAIDVQPRDEASERRDSSEASQ